MEIQSKDKIVLWDLDNTIAPWGKWAAEAYPAMAEAISEETRLSLKEVMAHSKAFYNKAGTMECAWLAQYFAQNGLLEDVDSDVPKLVKRLQKVYFDTRRRHLEMYPEIEETLEGIQKAGIKNVICTDAPAFHAANRIKYLKITDYFSGMIALPDPALEMIPDKHKPKYDGGRYGLDYRVKISKNAKPDTDLVEHLGMSEEEISERVQAVIGDAPLKDIALAKRFGIRGILAEYGKLTSDELMAIGPFSNKRNSSKNAPAPSLNHDEGGGYSIARHPSDILPALGL